MPRLPKTFSIGAAVFATGPFCPWTPKPMAEMIEICPSDCSCHAAGETGDHGLDPDQEQGGERINLFYPLAKPIP